MKNSTIIANGRVVDPARQSVTQSDLLIRKDNESATPQVTIGKPGEFNQLIHEVEQIDATGCYVTPGFVDLHVHLRDPGHEWKETIQTGSEAAVLGGVTSICCMPNTEPRNDKEEITRYILERAKRADAARIFPIGAVTVDLKGKELSPFSELVSSGCVAFSDDGEPVYDAGIMRRALEWCGMHNVPIMCHEEDKALSCGGVMNESPLSCRLGLPGMAKVAEEVMIARDIELARVTKGHVHICHVSTARGVELIRRAKNDGIRITAEVTPHHLIFTEDKVIDFDTNSKMSPPLREQEDCDALLQGLRDGTIDCIASDHAPHDLDTKRVEFEKASFGILGLQTNLPIVYDLIRQEKLSLLQVVTAFSYAPAKLTHLPCGTLECGDIVIVDPSYSWKMTTESIQSKSKNTPFLNRELTGSARSVFVGGNLKVLNGMLRTRGAR